MNTIINFYKIGLLVIGVQFLLASGCKKGTTPCAFGSYSFAVTSEWSPQNEIYNIGDTIFLNSTFPKTLPDLVNPSHSIDYSNATGISGDIRIRCVDTILRQVVPAKDSFQLISLIGNFIERENNQNSGVNFLYLETSSNYQFKGAIICKKKGIYATGVSDLYSKGLRGKDCTNAGFSMTVNNSNKNLLLYERLMGITLDADATKRGYVFRVK